MARKSDILTYGRKLHDIGRVVSEAVCDAGGTDKDIERIFGDDLLRKIGLLVMGKLPLALKPSEIHAVDLIPKNTDGSPWEVVDDVEPSITDVSKLRPHRILKDDEPTIGGDEMRKRAKESGGNLGLVDGKRIIAGQNKLSVEFDGFHIPLPGTVLRDSRGVLYVAYLYRSGVRWDLNFSKLDDDWRDDDRFARSE